MLKGKLRAEEGGEVYEGEKLDALLREIRKEIECSVSSAPDDLPVKLWYKQRFAVGINEVTRFLEGMPSMKGDGASLTRQVQPWRVNLQAVLVAGDCNPKWLTRHLPGLAASRKVPLIFVADNKRGSLKLGELVNMKTAIAIGIKDRGNTLNQLMTNLLDASKNPD